MHPALESSQADLADLCRQRGVRRLEIFGSATRDDFEEGRSDLDFLVEFHDALPGSPLDRWFGLKDDLEKLFRVPVDLVSMRAIVNPYVRSSINRDRRTLYGA
jgi:predicted nucleotidyltransferase